MPDFLLEFGYIESGKIVAGIDEAGRGPLAGPVVAAAVILKNDELLHLGVNDSKQLNAKKRDYLFELIIEKSESFAFSAVDEQEIDKINILKATHKAMKNAVDELKLKPDFLLIDGNSYSSKEIDYRTIVKGDSKCLSIAAASIIAKVIRDRYVQNVLHAEFPEYGFDRHFGYATKEHIDNIKRLGPCKYHRKTFLKKILNKELSLF